MDLSSLLHPDCIHLHSPLASKAEVVSMFLLMLTSKAAPGLLP